MLQSGSFETFILTCVCLNTVLMSCQYYGQPDTLTLFSQLANFGFAQIFNIEAAMKVGRRDDAPHQDCLASL